MPPHDNLVSSSPLIQETIEILRERGGRAPAGVIAETVLQLPPLDAPDAALIVAELIKDDNRLCLQNNSDEVELVGEDVETRSLHDTDYVVVDVETTGAKTPPNRITEIGAYRVSRGRIVAEFQTLVNPQIPIPPFITQLTGITDEMVRDAPLFGEVVAGWLGFIERAVLVAHNAPFDIRFLNHEIGLIYPELRMVNAHLCTVSLARRILPPAPELPNRRLHTVADYFNVPIHNRHRAAGDARATAEIFLRMLDLLRRHDVRVLGEARRFKAPSPPHIA